MLKHNLHNKKIIEKIGGRLMAVESSGEAERLYDMGWQARDLNRPEQSDRCYHQSLEVAQAQNDKRAEAHANLALADNALHYWPPD
jgi:hypothetical protein